jgi:hypothetical protein
MQPARKVAEMFGQLVSSVSVTQPTDTSLVLEMPAQLTLDGRSVMPEAGKSARTNPRYLQRPK